MDDDGDDDDVNSRNLHSFAWQLSERSFSLFEFKFEFAAAAAAKL